jgi:23S rRNA pseudouridine955/2504/2580 synthase
MAAMGHPIVGDAKYGGPEAILTGGNSPKLHMHARRIRIDAPDGGAIDVTAELPPHIAESLATLGFDPLAGDSLPMDKPPPSPAAKQRKVAAAAKARRRERRGERRARGGQPKTKRR